MDMNTSFRSLIFLSGLLLCSVVTAAPADQDSPLAGTGIEPNVVSYSVDDEVDDPLMRLNRGIFAFNDIAYRYALIPFSRAYNAVLPSAVRTSIGNVFDNIKSPIPFVNHLIQGEPRSAMIDAARFGVNSTVGILGLFDPATSWLELERQDTGFAETLAHYSVGHGTYIVLPFIGPSNLRDGGSIFADSLLNPLRYVFDDPESSGLRIFDNVQEFAPQAPAYLELRKNSADLYIFMRNAHLQDIQRDAEYK